MMNRFFIVIALFLITSCTANAQEDTSLIVGAENTDFYLEKMKRYKVALVCNQTSMVRDTHLLDFLLSNGVDVKKVMTPEHGFRGNADAGEKINSKIDEKTKIPIVSLYGKNKKPTAEQLEDVDVVVFDIQDVGVRFYTYISTLQYVMEACAENSKILIIMDRPNPNAHYVDGPVLDTNFKSFVGMQDVPIVYGLTMGEYAMMLKLEGKIPNAKNLFVRVSTMKNYHRNRKYPINVAPSPNLRTDQAIALYPSLCLFEGTNVSVGRGTDNPFEKYGSPFLYGKKYTHTFTPKSGYGSKYPKFENKLCYGEDLSSVDSIDKLNLSYIIDAYKNWKGDKNKFFLKNNFIDKLWGSSDLRNQIMSGKTEEEIRNSWKSKLNAYKEVRKKYLFYPD